MNNYEIQVMQAKKHFLTYDQQELIEKLKRKELGLPAQAPLPGVSGQ